MASSPVRLLRWTWRVSFYGYSALGTDCYPPFTTGDAPDYPARLEIDYPEQQRRGLPLVFVVGVLLLFKDRYPRDVFDVMMGFNHWVIRVLAFALLLTPQDPPFRLTPAGASPRRRQRPPEALRRCEAGPTTMRNLP